MEPLQEVWRDQNWSAPLQHTLLLIYFFILGGGLYLRWIQILFTKVIFENSTKNLLIFPIFRALKKKPNFSVKKLILEILEEVSKKV